MVKRISEMLTNQQYLELIRDRGERGLELSRVYRNIQKEEMFLAAYLKIQGNTGATAPGTDPNDTVDGMSLKRIRKIIEELGNGTYRCKPTRRIYIPKANGKLRPLSIPNWSDKLVQEVLRMTLEAYYEPQFSKHSHGFRPKRGCHTALTEIKNQWKGTKWLIEGDIKGCFDNIDHDRLLEIMERKIKDNRLMKLIRHMLEAGYMDNWRYNRTNSGTPQGGVISPLLANIYLNELDTFIETVLMPWYNRGKERKRNNAYDNLNHKAAKARKNGSKEQAKTLELAMRQMPSKDPTDNNYRRLRYVRYADDFLLGFEGSKEEAEAIKDHIGQFLRGQLKLEMSDEKTLITHATSTPANFLGYNIITARNNNYIKYGRRAANGNMQLSVPAKVLHEWIKWYTEKGIPHHRADLLQNTDYDITMHYEAELRGITNYYMLASNVGKFYRLKHTMMESLVMTLAWKHKTSKKDIYRKHATIFDTGMKGIMVEIKRDGKPPLVAKFGRQPIRCQRVAVQMTDQQWKPTQKRSQLADRLLAEKCELCESTEVVEVHHIRKLGDIVRPYRRKEKPAWAVKMAEIRRKTLVVCHECHQKITWGTYDGTAISRRAG